MILIALDVIGGVFLLHGATLSLDLPFAAAMLLTSGFLLLVDASILYKLRSKEGE